jgi:hypothetical protein
MTPANRADGAVPEYEHFQAVPLYTRADTEIYRWFRDNAETELQDVTGKELTIFIPRTVFDGESSDVYKAVEEQPGPDGKPRRRYPGLLRRDLPCLWIEGVRKGGRRPHTTLPLPRTGPEITDLFRNLSDAASKSSNFDQFLANIRKNKALPRPAQDRRWLELLGLVALNLAAVLIYVGVAAWLPGQAGGVVSIFALSAIGLLAAYILFQGIASYDSYAELSGKFPPLDARFRLGGPAAIWGLVILVGGYWSFHLAPFVSAFYFVRGGNPNDRVHAGGSLELTLYPNPVSAGVRDGHATVTNLDRSLDGKKVPITVDIGGYELANPGQHVTLSDSEPILVPLKAVAGGGGRGARTFACTIRFHLKGDRNKVVERDGRVVLQLNDDLDVPIVDGRASASGISQEWSDRDVGFRLDLPGYRAAEAGATLHLRPDGRLFVAVEPEPAGEGAGGGEPPEGGPKPTPGDPKATPGGSTPDP